jgi:hypothetical protein
MGAHTGQRDREKEREKDRERERERKGKMMAALKGMAGALATFGYLGK